MEIHQGRIKTEPKLHHPVAWVTRALPPRAQFVIGVSVMILAFKGAGAGHREGRDAGIPSTTALFCAYCVLLSVLPFTCFFPRDRCAHGGSYLAARC